MTKHKAKKGGEIGINGEYYEGGQFLPSSPTTIKGENKSHSKVNKPRKQEIAPYKWETSSKKAIWGMVEPVCKFHKTGYSKETGGQGQLEVFVKPNGYWTEEQVIEFQKLANLWNNGQRWI